MRTEDIDAIARILALVTDNLRVAPVDGIKVSTAERVPYTVKAAISLAENVRSQLKVADTEPLFDLPARLANYLGTFVFPLDSATLACAGAVIEGRRFLFVSRRLEAMQLLACARALGTVLLMETRSGAQDVAFANMHSPTRAMGPRAHFAATFAVHLLVPTPALGISLRKLREIFQAKRPELGDIEILYASQIFGVAFGDMARRCERARLLPPKGARTLERYLEERFGSSEQRALQLQLPARPPVSIPRIPSVLLPALANAINDGVLSAADSADALGINVDQLRTLVRQGVATSESFWQ